MKTLSLLLVLVSLMGCKKEGQIEWYLATHPKGLVVNKGWNDWRGMTVVNDGDSFTYGYGVGAPESYPTVFTRITGLPTINRGMPGKKSDEILDSFLTSPKYFSNPHIIWSGRNNNWSTGQILDNIDAMVQRVGGNRVIVIGLLSGDWPVEYATDGQDWGYGQNMHWWTTTQVDSLLELKYPGHVFSPQPFFLSQPVTCVQDSIDKSHGIVYARFRSDQLHLNDVGYAMVADTLSRRVIY